MATNPHTIPYAAYLDLTRFVTRYVQSIDPIDGTGIPGRKLVALCLEAEELQFGTGEEGNTIEDGKKKVEGAIKKMVREGVLMPMQDSGNGSMNRGVGFRLGEGVKVADIAGMGEGEEKENMVPRSEKGSSSRICSGNASRNGYMGVILGEEEVEDEGQSAEDERMKQDQAKRAQPQSYTPAHSPTTFDESALLEESDVDTDPATPRNPKRRKRQDEIAESNTSSRYDTISLNRDDEVHHSPKREAKRIKRPWEEAGPDAEAEADVPRPSFEDEQRELELDKHLETLDPTVVAMYRYFQELFPGHDFEFEGDGFRCNECAKHLTANKYHFERHLRSKAHEDKMADRRGRAGGIMDTTFKPTSMRASVGNFSNYSMAPPDPIPVYAANTGQLSRSQMGLAFFQSLDADTNKNDIRMTFLEKRVAVCEKKVVEKIDGLAERIDGYDKRSAQEIEDLNDCVRNAQAENRRDVQETQIDIHNVERRTNDRLNGVDETVEGLKKSDEEYETSLFNMQKSVSESTKKTEEITEGFKTKLGNFSGRLSKFETDNKESIDVFTERLGKVEKDKSERVRKLGDRLDRYRGRVIELEDEQSRQKLAMTGFEAHGESITDIESSIQMLTDEIKRCKGNDETTREHNDHMEKELKGIKEKVSALQILIEENQRGKDREEEIEKLTAKRFAAMEKQMEEKITQVQRKYENDMDNLVEATWKQKDRLDGVEEDLQRQQKSIASQAGLIGGYEIQLKQRDEAIRKSNGAYEQMLRRYDEQIALQNQIIKVQRSDLDYHSTKIKQQSKKLEEQTKRLEKQKKSTKHTDLIVSEFMKDVRMLDDKIDDHIDDIAEKEAAREEKELQRKERLEEQKNEMAEEQKNRRRSSISRPALRRVSINPRSRVGHLSSKPRRTTMG